jgi:protein-tyrosine phosphatase
MNSIKVLFVCKGNICRSPTAHGVFRDIVQKKGFADVIKVESVGTSSRKWGHEKDSSDARSVAMAAKFDCDLSDLVSASSASNT